MSQYLASSMCPMRAGYSLLLLLAVALGVLSGCSTARSHLGTRFELDDVSSREAIREELFERFPGGTPEAEITAYLESRGIGDDARTEVFPANDESRSILCKVYDESFGLVREDYGVSFYLDDRRRLRDIRVWVLWTGP